MTTLQIIGAAMVSVPVLAFLSLPFLDLGFKGGLIVVGGAFLTTALIVAGAFLLAF